MMRPATATDAPALCAIYNHYIEHTTVTFEEEPIAPDEMARRMAEVMDAYPWLVWEEEGQVLGYAYGRPYHYRSAYRYTVEAAIYLDHTATGRGIGRQLYPELLNRLQAQGMHAIIGAIALPNEASVGLHEKLGFTKVGHMREVGLKFGQWLDVGYWQLLKG